MKTKTRILFFIAGSAPTAAEATAAAAIGTQMFRNASQVTKGETPERCDAVAGLVPVIYSKYPRADAPAAPSVQEHTPAVPAITEEDMARPPVATNPPDFVKPEDAAAAAQADDPVAAERAAQDEGARNATAAMLKAALVQLGIPFKPNTKKADLLALFLARPAAPSA